MNHLKHVITQVDLPALICDSQGRIEQTNDAYRQLFTATVVSPEEDLPKIPPEAAAMLLPDPETKKPLKTCLVQVQEVNCILHIIQLPREMFFLIFIPADPHLYTSALIRPFRERIWQLETFLETSYDGFWICDKEGRVVYINQAAVHLNSLEGQDIIGRNVSDLVTEGYYDRSATLEVLTKKKEVTILVHSANGKQLLATGKPMFDQQGGIKNVIVNVRDVTLLEELKEKLGQIEALSERYLAEAKKLQTLSDIRDVIVYSSPEMDRLMDRVSRAAATDANILITGESGVGKGLIAEAVHRFSKRSQGPFFSVNCGMLPPNLIESELFGYKAGAFTGALAGGKPGLVEMAENGTLFMDEIGELPLSMQVKLLEFLENRTFTHVGDVQKKTIDTRIICATNRDLEEAVACGDFRADLYFRLSTVPILVPPLRRRREDIPVLINHFLHYYNQKYNKRISLTVKAAKYLLHQDYKGNVRELRHLLERVVVLADKEWVDIPDLEALVSVRSDAQQGFITIPADLSLNAARDLLEKKLIQQSVNRTGNQQSAARLLGVDQSTISRKMNKYKTELY